MTANEPDVCEVTDKTCFVQAREQSDVQKHISQTSMLDEVCHAGEKFFNNDCLRCFCTDEIWLVGQNLDAVSFSKKSEASCVQLLCMANFVQRIRYLRCGDI